MTRCRLHNVEDCAICRAAGEYAPDGPPYVNGVRVRERVYCEYERTCGVWRLTRETFDHVETDILKAALAAGADADALGWRLDVCHVVDVTGVSPEAWRYVRHGRTEPSGRSRDGTAGGIPQTGMREAAIDAYLSVKVRGEPEYALVQYAPGKRFRRLLLPVIGKRGYVERIISAIVTEAPQSVAA